MVLIKLTAMDDGSIRAESPSWTQAFYFEDITLPELRDYLSDKHAEIDERVRFVEEFEPQLERLSDGDLRHLMKGKKKK